MSQDRVNLVLLARIGAAHGLRGEVRVNSFTADPLAFGSYGPLISTDGRVFAVERSRPAKEVVITKFRGVDDRNKAEALNGTDLFISRDRLPEAEEDEFYLADLIGLEAATEGGETLGSVIEIHNFGAGDILEIAPPRGPSLLLPFTKECVPNVDISAGRLTAIVPAEVEVKEGDEL